MIGATVSAGVIYLILWKGLGFAQDKSYYTVVLSFLLIHYFYDHILFRDFEPLNPSAEASASRRREGSLVASLLGTTPAILGCRLRISASLLRPHPVPGLRAARADPRTGTRRGVVTDPGDVGAAPAAAPSTGTDAADVAP
jgi:hypothetical protein